MTDKALYDSTCNDCSRVITGRYSTSFSLGIRLFERSLRKPIYGIYGFVRFADEIVDTFHEHDKKALLDDFRKETFKAIELGISLNPVLHSFQMVVNEYKLDHVLVADFLDSMEMDLHKTTYENREVYQKYIYGSAEVVGLMCLQVFCRQNKTLFGELAPFARSLGAAFQKINFLRDINSDIRDRGRVYFPGLDLDKFDELAKQKIIDDIQADLNHAIEGIRQLPKGARGGVYLAYMFYNHLFKQIKATRVEEIMKKRISVRKRDKAYLLMNTALRHSMNLL